MTDFADSCFHCGGHLRRNVWSGVLCPECETRHQRGEITAFGDVVEQLADEPRAELKRTGTGGWL